MMTKEQRVCRHCHLDFNPATTGTAAYCSTRCREAHKLRKTAKAAVWRPDVVKRKHRGVHSEIMACAWLMEQRYEVFKNVSHFGPIDIVAIKGPVTRLIDVKTVRPTVKVGTGVAGDGRILNNPARTEDQKDMGVELLYVTPDGLCSFSLHDLEAMYTTIYQGHLDMKH